MVLILDHYLHSTMSFSNIHCKWHLHAVIQFRSYFFQNHKHLKHFPNKRTLLYFQQAINLVYSGWNFWFIWIFSPFFFLYYKKLSLWKFIFIFILITFILSKHFILPGDLYKELHKLVSTFILSRHYGRVSCKIFKC